MHNRIDQRGGRRLVPTQSMAAKACVCELQLACLDVLAEGPTSVTVVARRVGWTQPEVSRALARLRLAGCVSFTQHKRERLYAISEQICPRREGERLVFDIPSGDGGVLRVIRPPQPSTIVLVSTSNGGCRTPA